MLHGFDTPKLGGLLRGTSGSLKWALSPNMSQNYRLLLCFCGIQAGKASPDHSLRGSFQTLKMFLEFRCLLVPKR